MTEIWDPPPTRHLQLNGTWLFFFFLFVVVVCREVTVRQDKWSDGVDGGVHAAPHFIDDSCLQVVECVEEDACAFKDIYMAVSSFR